MDNAEQQFVSYDADELWQAMQQAYTEAGGDPLYDDDEKYMVLRSAQLDIMQVFAGVENAMRMQTLKHAVGYYLDAIGQSRGCTRLEPRQAKGMISIYFGESGHDEVTIPEGTSFTANGTIIYTVDREYTITPDETYQIMNATCTETGPEGNLAGYEPMEQVTGEKVDAVSIMTEEHGFTGGMDTETDDHYRERIRMTMSSTLTTGTKAQYESAVLMQDSRIKQAYARGNTLGTDVYICCEDTGIEPTVRLAISSYLQDVSPFGAGNSWCVIAQSLNYTLKITVSMDDHSPEDLAPIKKEYMNWQNNVMGRAFVPEKLVARLLEAGFRNARIDSSSRFDGKAASYTAIQPYQRCMGTVEIEGVY